MKSWIAFALGGLMAAVIVTAVYQYKVSSGTQEVASSTPVAAEPAPSEAPPVQAAEPAAAPPAPSAKPQPRPAAPQGTPRAKPASPPAETVVLPPQPAPAARPAETEPPISAPVPVTPKAEPVTPPPPPPRVPKTVTVAEGTLLPVRLLERVSTETHKAGESFSATLDQPLVVDGFVIAERGARVEGEVTQSVEAGRVKGVAQLGLVLTRFTTADGQRVPIRTAEFAKEGEKSTKQDATKVGIGAAIGSAIGAIAGGGKGAAIGAAAGAGAGTGAVLATRGEAAELPSETRLTFRLAEAVKITERLK